MIPSDVTLAKDTIHNPDEPRRFMTVTPVKGRVRVRLGDLLVAESDEALRLKEVGRLMYDPTLYLPRRAIAVPLMRAERESHCPLKGDCTWYSLQVPAEQEIAWSYREPFHFARVIASYVSFDPERVTIEEFPA
ncbi:MAG: DUF427 domain-containing protein [Pseudomonadota bacterium]